MDYVIIVAGGKGLRMGTEIPKQFLPIGGRPVLMRTLERFREYSPTLQMILVLPKAQQDYWRELCQQYNFPLPQQGGARGGSSRGGSSYLLADGGETRFHSVQNGLALIPDDAEGVVGVHDGVRPFPSIDVIRRCYETARIKKAVVPVIPVVETLRHITEGTKPRGDYRLVQTPQTFDIQLLKAAYKRAQNQVYLDSAEREQARPKVKAANRQPYNDAFTDDASVVEAFGFDITLVEGNRENIKITTPYDLKIAEILVS
jgi:2-C-methyl-D-erythritol 4-phosphate cytidylyltransferase